ncbi:Ubiquitin-conjugating enzyme E2 H [Perkinsus chesapeaki]|uniref:Ubiquitin-conjugating enzyme E2 H n=1 Tax=Perkinsus chesapeaki TaxID=330153 RepID=A0A7J6MQF6_PERCH|nr:Ubiquitin-conjugating enzyme E2 H [Perkinsus chesapeaki]
MSQATAANRKHTDFARLMRAGYQVDADPDSKNVTQDFSVVFYAPESSPYKGGIYRIHVELPEQYPYQSPSIGFRNRIFHPNIDERSGSVCLDVINQTWTPLYSLVNIFDVFLPQLLAYPNPSDPLNPDAAALMLRDKTAYSDKCQEYVRLYASSSSILGRKSSDDEVDEACSPQASPLQQPRRMSPTALTPVVRGRPIGGSSDVASRFLVTSEPCSRGLGSPRGLEASMMLAEVSLESAQDESMSDGSDAVTVSELSQLDCVGELDLEGL